MSERFRPYAVPEPSARWRADSLVEGYADDDADRWYDEGPSGDDLGMLTEVVFVEGELVDSRRRPVRGSGYERVAQDLGAARRPPRVEYVQTAPPPHHEPMLRWLDRVVGGREALLALDDLPLPAEELDCSAFRDVDVPRLLAIDALVARALGRLVEGQPMVELRTATRRLMRYLLAADRQYLARSERDDLIAGGLFHAVGRASNLIGADRPLLSRSVTEAFELKSPPSSRSSSIVSVVGGHAWWYDTRPRGAPDVPVLGHADLLVSTFRRELVTARDLALAEAAELAADLATELAVGRAPAADLPPEEWF